jgi:hypothetical protein
MMDEVSIDHVDQRQMTKSELAFTISPFQIHPDVSVQVHRPFCRYRRLSSRS